MNERSDGVFVRPGDAGFDEEPDEVIVGLRRSERDANPRRGDVVGQDDAIWGRRSLRRAAVTRDHGTAREHRRARLESVGRP